MTTPERRRIRDAFCARLKAPLTSGPGAGYRTVAADRVFTSRTLRLFRKDLPAILIYARSEDAVGDTVSDGSTAFTVRNLRLAVEGIVEAEEGIDDRLDELAEQIETAIDGFDIPGLETARIDYAGTEIQVDTDAETPFGGVRLTYTVRYRRTRDIPPEGIPPPSVFLGISPTIGAAHEGDYVLISDPDTPCHCP